MDLISILMPVKNAARFLPASLGSILGQTETHWELIAVDDHSTDESAEILKQFAAVDPRIKIFDNQSHGIIPALRLALDQSSGLFITRMDADDEMYPQKLAVLKKGLQGAGYGHIAIGQVSYFSDEPLGDGYQQYEKWLNELITTGDNWREMYKECVIPSPNWMLYREDLLKTGAFWHDRYPEDYDLCFRMYESGLIPIATRECTHKWRDHPDRFSRNDPHYRDNRFLDLKVHYFLKLDYQPSIPLILWGAGRKGKDIAKLLIDRKINFEWFCNQKQKIGHNVYGKVLKDSNHIEFKKELQFIIAVAGPKAQKGIRHQMIENMGEMPGSAKFFC